MNCTQLKSFFFGVEAVLGINTAEIQESIPFTRQRASPRETLQQNSCDAMGGANLKSTCPESRKADCPNTITHSIHRWEEELF